jgi:enoyl-CoA hydratase/carnithine racemase
MELISTIGVFEISLDPMGIALVVFSRPPVNAVSLSVYEDIGKLADLLENDGRIKVVILTSPESSRCWCGGADLNDFVGMDADKRRQRYQFINEQLPRFYHLSKPVIAALNGHAIGIGMIWAGLCDLRIAAEDAMLACPEIKFGLVAGGGGVFSMLKIPEAKMREMLYTGKKFSARELESTGFFNYVLPRDQVRERAMSLAEEIAQQSLPAVQARKQASNSLEGLTWMEAYLEAQRLSAGLVENKDSQEGVQAFLQNRAAKYSDQ